MALPKQDDMELPLLREIENMGGEAHPSDLYPKVTAYFPQITQADLNLTTKQGGSLWENRIQFARQKLVEKGEMDKSVRGIWKITDKGRDRLRRGKIVPPTPPPPPPPEQPDKLAEEIKGLVEKLAELAQKGKEETARLTHDEMIDKIREMAEMLGKVTDPVSGVPYRHDCVWRDNPYANPKLVVEVCDRGNLDKDIASLDWGVSNWRANGILVLFEKSDFDAAQKKLAYKNQIYPLKAEDVLKLHSLLQAGYTEAIRTVFTI